MKDVLEHNDPQVAALIRNELGRQRLGLELIASENFASPAVLAAAGSVFTNKYAEGYPSARYYGGCEFADQLEDLAAGRARRLFRAEHANVQPHCGSAANMAAYLTVMKPGDTLMAMSLAHGGHLTHGAPVSFSGRLFNVLPYGVRADDELIDYDDLLARAEQHKPAVIVAGASAYPQSLDFDKFRAAAEAARAVLIVDMAHIAGLVAAGLHPSPVEAADIVTSTTHKTLRGPRSGLILSKKALARRIDSQVFPGLQGGPLMHIIAAKAVAFGEALTDEFKAYQRQVLANAKRLAEGLRASGFRLVSGGTATHLILLDLRPGNQTGLAAEKALEKAGLATNKNAVPFDPQPSSVTSGLRLGSAALTTRGFKEAEMDQVAEFIGEALGQTENEAALSGIRGRVEALARRFPLYPGLE